MNRFSIIINTDGRRVALENTIKSLRYLDSNSFEVCVVYGPTEDGTREYVNSLVGQVKIGCCAERNLSKSRNIGIGLAAGDLVAFIDDDAIPERAWLRDLLPSYDDERVAGAGGVVYDHTGWAFQYLYATADRLGNADWGHKKPAEEFNFPLSDKFPYLQGTNASFRRDILIEIGGFDEEYEFYLDETDVCCRLVDAGYKLKQLSNAAVYHKFLPSSIRNVHKVTKNYYPIIKNKIYFSLKNNQGHYALNDVMADAQAFISSRAEEVRSHNEAGRLASSDVERFWEDVDRAWRHGLIGGLTRERSLLSVARAQSLQQPFLEFPRPAPQEGRKLFCFMSQEYPPARVGGIGTYTHAVALGLAELGHHVHVLTKADNHNTVDFENGIWVHRLEVKTIEKPDDAVPVPERIWNYSATMREELHKINAKFPVTAVEAPIWDAEGIALIDEGFFPTALSLHTTLAIWLETHKDMITDLDYTDHFATPMLAAEKHLLECSEFIHANSRSIVDRLTALYGVDFAQKQLTVIAHGVTEPKNNEYHERAVSELRLLFIGRLEPRKGIDTLLMAMPGVIAQCPQAKLDIVGDDTVPWSGHTTFRERFNAQPYARACKGHVHFWGKLAADELQSLLTACDVLVVPSRYESFGLTIIEAFACGKAVVATRTGGMQEIIADNETGILVDADDPLALQRAISKLASSPKLRSDLGSAARNKYIEKYTAKRMATDLAPFLSQIERLRLPQTELSVLSGSPREVTLWGEETGLKLLKGDIVELRALGPRIYLTFWRHNWSGLVRISADEKVLSIVDLYSRVPWLKTYSFDLDEGSGRVVVEALGENNPRSSGAEVIFYCAQIPSTHSPAILSGRSDVDGGQRATG